MNNWRTGILTLRDLGFKQSKKIRAVEKQLWSVNAEIEYDHETDTHARTGEFGNLLRADAKAIKTKANGREIFASPDYEWFTVYFFFGDEDEIVGRLKRLLAQKRRVNKEAKFTDDPLTTELVDELGWKFAPIAGSGRTWTDRKWRTDYKTGEPTSVYFERNDGWQLRVSLEENTVEVEHYDITKRDENGWEPRRDKRILNTLKDIESFIEWLGPDLPARPKTYDEVREDKMWELLEPIIGSGAGVHHKGDQGYAYFGVDNKNCGSLTRERVNSAGNGGKLYLHVYDVSDQPYGAGGYIDNDADLESRLITALGQQALNLEKKLAALDKERGILVERIAANSKLLKITRKEAK